MKAMLLGISIGIFGLAVSVALNGIVGVVICAFGVAFSIAGYRDNKD